MKKIFLIILIPIYCFSQDNNYIIDYELIRTKGEFTLNADGKLTINSKNDISEFKLSQYKNLLKDGNKIYSSKKKDTITVLGSNKICPDKRIYYYDFKKDSTSNILYNKYCKSKVIINNIINYPKWDIKNEFKKIGDYEAQKATAFVNDRTWTVYFTNELGINGGPWNLIGLPGLVLEATENTLTYEFRLTKLNKSNVRSKIVKPYYKKQSTFEEYVKKAVKRQTDEMYFRLAKIGEIDKSNFPLYETLDFIEKRD